MKSIKGNLVFKHNKAVFRRSRKGRLAVIVRYRPNLFMRFLYWTGLLKDPRYNGKKFDHVSFDEYGQYDSNPIISACTVHKKPSP
jgi:hypothetical protein